MQRAAVSVLKRGAARRQGCGLCLLTGTGQRPIFTGSAGLRNDNEIQRGTAPEPQENAEKKEAAPQARDDLLNLIGGMKVEISTKRKLRALRTDQVKDKTKAEPETMESTTSMFQHATEEIKNQSNKTLSPDLVAAASAVASSMPHNKKQIESELLQQLRKHESETEAQKNGDVSNIGNIIANMKVGKRPGARAGFRSANQIHFDEDGQGYVPPRGVTSEFNALKKRKGIYTGKRLNIFPAHTESENVPETVARLSLWDIELANEIATLSEQLPRNGFEEMIQWTKEGKLWQFPINNEAGLEEEESVEFHEHIYLEKHLHGFSQEGPIRHFMELVVNGLSKNPYLTVQQKIEHIDWFRQYFQGKQDILNESEMYIN
ncbi:28S ribosomal protein S31, mitochondrial [Mobula hypostoma]|uniref:28S ribosomal protein S31, mitochondrial n=1 Tax=Mobula hypostoma TaxID=723540 RepID=UPI002FC2ED3B